jgi:succinate dehydrogenase hydrophobic anchor subunit
LSLYQSFPEEYNTGDGVRVNAMTWLLQRISAAVLLVLLGVHLWLLYMTNASEVISFAEAKARLVSAPFITLYVLLLLFGLFHALNGLYTVMVDMGIKPRKTAISALLAVGLSLFGVGLISIFQFIM